MNNFSKVLTMRFSVLVIVLMAFFSSVKAQSCRDVLDVCPEVDEFFNFKAMARTYKIHPSQKLKVYYVFYGSKGYHIGLCTRDTTTKFHIKLIDKASGTVFWDNIEDDYSSAISISFGSTQRILMEVSPVEPQKITQSNSCLGVVISYHKEEDKTLPSPSSPDEPIF